MFSYLEHILEHQDKAEVDRLKANVEDCRKILQNLGYADLTFEDSLRYSLSIWNLLFKEKRHPLVPEGTEQLKGAVINTFQEFESSMFDSLSIGPLIYPIGPVHDHVGLCDPNLAHMST